MEALFAFGGGRGIHGLWGGVTAIILIALGVVTAFGVVIRRLRWRWSRTRVCCGAISTVSMALFLISFGITYFYAESHPGYSKKWQAMPFVIAWIIGSIGYIVDSRTVAEDCPKFTLPNERQKQPLYEWRGWVCFVGGVILLLWSLFGSELP